MPTPARASPAANPATADRWDGGPLWDPVKTATRTTRACHGGAGAPDGVHWAGVPLDRRLGDLRARPPALGAGRRGRPAGAPRRRRRPGAAAAAPGHLVAPRRHVGDAGWRAARRGVRRARRPPGGAGGAGADAAGPAARPVLGRRPRRLVLHHGAGPAAARHRARRPAAGRRERRRRLDRAGRPGVGASAPGLRGVAVPPARPARRLNEDPVLPLKAPLAPRHSQARARPRPEARRELASGEEDGVLLPARAPSEPRAGPGTGPRASPRPAKCCRRLDDHHGDRATRVPGGRSTRVKVLGINAIYHDPSAALVIDGRVVAAAEEERFSRRKHGKRPLPWS